MTPVSTPAPRGPRRPRAGGDAGVTLIEVVTAASIMSVVMAIVTGGILQAYRVANAGEAAATAQSQLQVAFERLDRDVRYAAGLSTEGVLGDDQYVEYLTGTGAAATCVGLRLHAASGRLQRRSWPATGAPPRWDRSSVLASGVTSTRPFQVAVAGAGLVHQQLSVHLVAASGGGRTAATAEGTVSFTALNSRADTPTAAAGCAAWRSSP